MNCPKCGSETSKVKISFFVRGNACSCGWCDFADKIKARPSLFSRFSSAFHSYKTYSYRWKFLRFRFGIPRFISKHFTRLPLYTEEEPIEISHSARPKEEKTKEQPLYKIRKRGWKEKRKAFKIGGSPPMNKRIKVHYLPIPMPKFMASAILTLFMIILAGGYQYVHIMYPFIPSVPFLFFLNEPKEKCALKGCDNPISEDSPISIVKGRTLRFCSQEHADIYSNTSQFGEYERVQKMYGRRDLLKGIALAGLGAGVAGLLSGMKISEAAVDTTKPAIVSQFSQIGDASIVVFQDKNGNSYVVDKGVGPQLGELIVKANVITPYGAGLGAGTAGAQTQTGGILEAANVLPNNGELYIKEGTYNIAQTITITKPITIKSNFVTIRMSNGANLSPMLSIHGSGSVIDYICLDRVIFDGNRANQTTLGDLVQLYDVDFISITNCAFINSPRNGLYKKFDVVGTGSVQAYIAGCWGYNNSYATFRGEGFGDSIFEGNQFGPGINEPMINLINCAFHLIRNNKLYGSGNGNEDNILQLTDCRYMSIVGNSFDRAAKNAINIYCDTVGWDESYHIIGNFIYEYSDKNINVYNGINIYGVSGVTPHNILIAGNYINGNVVGTTTAHGAYGIQAIANDVFCTGNKITGNLTAPLVLTGSNNLAVNNRGFNPQGFTITTPAMPTSGTAQSNTFFFPVIVYLYGGTVTQITINGQVVFSSGTGISLTGQSFTLNPGDTIAITYTVAPTWKWYGL